MPKRTKTFSEDHSTLVAKNYPKPWAVTMRSVQLLFVCISAENSNNSLPAKEHEKIFPVNAIYGGVSHEFVRLSRSQGKWLPSRTVRDLLTLAYSQSANQSFPV
jgi:hypothetical protein